MYKSSDCADKGWFAHSVQEEKYAGSGLSRERGGGWVWHLTMSVSNITNFKKYNYIFSYWVFFFWLKKKGGKDVNGLCRSLKLLICIIIMQGEISSKIILCVTTFSHQQKRSRWIFGFWHYLYVRRNRFFQAVWSQTTPAIFFSSLILWWSEMYVGLDLLEGITSIVRLYIYYWKSSNNW